MTAGRQLAWVDGEEEYLDVMAGLGQTCRACGVKTSVQNFHRDCRREDGRKPRCKRCVRDDVPLREDRRVSDWAPAW